MTTSTSKQEVEKTEGQTSAEYYGDSVYTTLDPELQKAAYDALGDYHGAVVAVDTQTGEVLAMVSKPDFDPNEAGTKYNEWASIQMKIQCSLTELHRAYMLRVLHLKL